MSVTRWLPTPAEAGGSITSISGGFVSQPAIDINTSTAAAIRLRIFPSIMVGDFRDASNDGSNSGRRQLPESGSTSGCAALTCGRASAVEQWKTSAKTRPIAASRQFCVLPRAVSDVYLRAQAEFA